MTKTQKNAAAAAVTIILDAQYGSCGKGSYAQFLARQENPHILFRTGGPNAGHSVRTPEGVFPLRHIPAGAVECQGWLVLGPAALINPEVLRAEIQSLEDAGYDIRSRLMIDPLTTIISHEDEHAEAQGGMRAAIGSTMEGVGAAQSAKIMRRAKTARDLPELEPYLADTWGFVNSSLNTAEARVHIEMTQGYGLSLHAGSYPYATSRDITPGQALSDCGISPSHPALRGDGLRVALLARTFPIRVAGNSGPLANEIDWDTLAAETHGYVKAERTTVTKLVRRVGRWNAAEVERAAKVTRPSYGVLMFTDYLYPEVGSEFEEIMEGAGGDLTDPQVAEFARQVQGVMNHAWHAGELDAYRAPYQESGVDIAYLSLGFGLFVPTPYITESIGPDEGPLEGTHGTSVELL